MDNVKQLQDKTMKTVSLKPTWIETNAMHGILTPKVLSYKEISATLSPQDIDRLQQISKLVFEIKKTPEYGGSIMRGFSSRDIDSNGSMCLLNFSNLFYDNLYLEEKN